MEPEPKNDNMNPPIQDDIIFEFNRANVNLFLSENWDEVEDMPAPIIPLNSQHQLLQDARFTPRTINPFLEVFSLNAALSHAKVLFEKEQWTKDPDPGLLIHAKMLWTLAKRIIPKHYPLGYLSITLMRTLCFLGSQTIDCQLFLDVGNLAVVRVFPILVDCGLVSVFPAEQSLTGFPVSIYANVHSKLLSKVIREETKNDENILSYCLTVLRNAVRFRCLNFIAQQLNVLTIWKKALKYPKLMKKFQKVGVNFLWYCYWNWNTEMVVPWVIGHVLTKTLDKFNALMNPLSPTRILLNFMELNYILQFEWKAIGNLPYSYEVIVAKCKDSRLLFEGYTGSGKTGKDKMIIIFQLNAEAMLKYATNATLPNRVKEAFLEELLRHFKTLFERPRIESRHYESLPGILKCLKDLDRYEDLLPILRSITAQLKRNRAKLFKYPHYNFLTVCSKILSTWPNLCKLPTLPGKALILEELIIILEFQFEYFKRLVKFGNNSSRIQNNLDCIIDDFIHCFVPLGKAEALEEKLQEAMTIRMNSAIARSRI